MLEGDSNPFVLKTNLKPIIDFACETDSDTSGKKFTECALEHLSKKTWVNAIRYESFYEFYLKLVNRKDHFQLT